MPKDDSRISKAATKAAARAQGPAAEAQAQSLHLAARKGNLPAVRRLLERGASVDQKTESGKTALHVAAQVCRSTSACFLNLIIIIYDFSAWIDLYVGIELIIFSFQFGQLSAAKILVEFGSNLESRTSFNRTPLHLAAAQGHLELVQYLLSCKADLTARTPDGDTPCALARKYSYADVQRVLEQASSE
jgi:ankyrin repeat protein